MGLANHPVGGWLHDGAGIFSYCAWPSTDADSQHVALGANAANRATVNVLWLNRRVDYAVLPIIIAR